MDNIQQMIMALRGEQAAPPPDPAAVQGALSQTLLHDPQPTLMQEGAAQLHNQLNETGNAAEWAMALAGGPRLSPKFISAPTSSFWIKEGATGRNVGDMTITENHPKPGNLYVEGVYGNLPSQGKFVKGEEGVNSLGPADTRTLLQEVQKQYPDATSIGGYRVSGARYFTGGGPRNVQVPLKPLAPSADRIEAVANKWSRDLAAKAQAIEDAQDTATWAAQYRISNSLGNMDDNNMRMRQMINQLRDTPQWPP